LNIDILIFISKILIKEVAIEKTKQGLTTEKT